MQTFTVDEKNNQKRCDKFLFENLPVPPSQIFKAFRKRSIKVNGKRVREDYVLNVGDQVEVYIPDAYLSGEPTVEINMTIPIVFEDDNILIVSKPQGMSVHEDEHGNEQVLDVLVRRMKSQASGNQNNPFPALCHRIDRNTGGLVILAKNQETLEVMHDKFKHHEIRKFYLAAVHGIPQTKSETLTGYLKKDSQKSRVFIYDRPVPGTEKIITRYRLLTAHYPYALLEVEIVTGKTHQIRAHLAYQGFPLLGDGKYGINTVNRSLKLQYQALFSYRLVFDFNTPSGHLNYLKGKEIKLDNPTWEMGIGQTGLDMSRMP